MSTELALFAIRLAEEGEKEANHLLSYGIGALVLGILVALMLGLLFFGGGRDHT